MADQPTFAPDSRIEPLDTSWSDVASQAIENAPERGELRS